MARYFLSVAAMIAFAVTACSQTTPASNGEAVDMDDRGSIAPVTLFSLPEQLTFAEEAVPLQNYDTRESLSRELQTNAYLHARTMLTLQATARYFPIIEPILSRYGVPDDMKYLCVAESGLNPNVVSPAGAAGLWQLMAATGRSYGLFVGTGVDERYNIEKSTEAACKYLQEAYKRFGSWTMAAASYNLGQAGVSKRMTTQGVESYYDLYLPEETMRYVFRIMAFKLIIESPEEYGYILATEDYYRPLTDYREVEVSGAVIDWSAEARKHGTNYKMLRELNHWIRDYVYTNSGKRVFRLRIPGEGMRNER